MLGIVTASEPVKVTLELKVLPTEATALGPVSKRCGEERRTSCGAGPPAGSPAYERSVTVAPLGKLVPLPAV